MPPNEDAAPLPPPPPRAKRIYVRFLALLGILAAGLVVLRASDLGPLITDPHRLHQVIRAQGGRAALYFLLFNVVRPLLFVPASVAAVTSGYAFGPWYGTVYSVVGGTLGGAVSFFVSRRLGRDFIETLFLSGRLKGFDHALERQGLKVIFLLRLIPVVYFDAVSYATGLTRIRFGDYLVGTVAGLIPATFVWVYAGAVLARGKWAWALALPLLATVLLLPFLWRWWRGPRGAAPTGSGRAA